MLAFIICSALLGGWILPFIFAEYLWDHTFGRKAALIAEKEVAAQKAALKAARKAEDEARRLAEPMWFVEDCIRPRYCR